MNQVINRLPYAALTAVAAGGRDFFVPDKIIKKKLDIALIVSYIESYRFLFFKRSLIFEN